MFQELPVVYRSTEEVRDLIIAYLEKEKQFPAADNNWRIVPDAAREAIEKQALSIERERATPKAKAASASYQ